MTGIGRSPWGAQGSGRSWRCCCFTRTRWCPATGWSKSCGAAPSDASKTLQVAVSRLRKALGPGGPLVTRPPGYELQLERERLDLHRFEDEARAGREALASGDAKLARAKLGDALAIWRGPALADLAYEPFAQAEASRLEELRASVTEERIAADLELGHHADLVGELQELVTRHPLARAPAPPADARPLPLRPPGRRARGLPGRPPGAHGRARDRAGPRAAGPAGVDAAPGPRARLERPGRRAVTAAHRARHLRRARARAGRADRWTGRRAGRARQDGLRRGRARNRQEPVGRRAGRAGQGQRCAGGGGPLLGGGRRARVLAVGAVAARLQP